MPWTGVGSRQTPENICRLMTKFSSLKKDKCRTGGADGADDAFLRGTQNVELFLPWRVFNGHRSGIWQYTDEQIRWADFILAKVTPFHISRMSVRQLFRRNVFQVLGLCHSDETVNLSKFLLCWTPDGALSIKDYWPGVTGGTGIAINVASLFGVPVFNMQRPKHLKEVKEYVEETV